jgi:hypothetical protein
MRHVSSTRLSYVVVFLLGVFIASSWHWLKSNFYFRPVQYLRSSDKVHQAALEREEHFLDLTFRVILDGQQIYRSPEFGGRPDIPFRETLLWDDSGNILLFEVGGHRLFGYDIAQSRTLSNVELVQVKASPVPDRKYGFEGQWPDK